MKDWVLGDIVRLFRRRWSDCSPAGGCVLRLRFAAIRLGFSDDGLGIRGMPMLPVFVFTFQGLGVRAWSFGFGAYKGSGCTV